MFRVTFGVTIYFQLLLSRFQQYLMQLKSPFEGWAIARNDRAARVWIVKIREIYAARGRFYARGKLLKGGMEESLRGKDLNRGFDLSRHR